MAVGVVGVDDVHLLLEVTFRVVRRPGAQMGGGEGGHDDDHDHGDDRHLPCSILYAVGNDPQGNNDSSGKGAEGTDLLMPQGQDLNVVVGLI